MALTAVERRGIEYVPPGERWGSLAACSGCGPGRSGMSSSWSTGCSGSWSSACRSLQALLVIGVGNLSYALTGLASLQGPRAGTTSFGVSRAAFGPNGNRVPSLFNWVTQVGFEIEGIALIVFAAIALAHQAGLHRQSRPG